MGGDNALSTMDTMPDKFPFAGLPADGDTEPSAVTNTRCALARAKKNGSALR